MTIDEAIAKNLDLFIDDVKKRHISAGQRVTGKTIDSLKRKSIGINHQVIEGNEYIGVLETGRKGGKIPRDFINILRNWANAKGITFENDKKATSWLKYQAWKISKFGTKQYISKQRIDIFTTPFEDLKKNLSKDLSVGIKSEITNKIFER